MKALITLLALLTTFLGGCTQYRVPVLTPAFEPTSTSALYTLTGAMPAAIGDVVRSEPEPPVIGPVLPAPECALIIKTTPTRQIAALDTPGCEDRLVWLDLTRAGVFIVAYGIRLDNRVIAALDVTITREDGGPVIRQIGPDPLLPLSVANLIWST